MIPERYASHLHALLRSVASFLYLAARGAGQFRLDSLRAADR
jgi:hypothetical protein